jgi:hypothetical protein
LELLCFVVNLNILRESEPYALAKLVEVATNLACQMTGRLIEEREFACNLHELHLVPGLEFFLETNKVLHVGGALGFGGAHPIPHCHEAHLTLILPGVMAARGASEVGLLVLQRGIVSDNQFAWLATALLDGSRLLVTHLPAATARTEVFRRLSVRSGLCIFCKLGDGELDFLEVE